MADSVKAAKTAIEARFNAAGVNAYPVLLEVDEMKNLKIGVDVDESKVTSDLIDKLQTFNDEADNVIFFEGGRIVRRGDVLLFVMYFNVGECDGGIG